MLAGIQDAAAREVEHACRGRRVGGSLAAVEGLRGSEEDAAPAALARPHREIHVLVVDEEPLIESAKRFEHAAANKEKGAHDLIDGARIVMRPFGHEMRREDRRHEPVQPDAVAGH